MSAKDGIDSNGDGHVPPGAWDKAEVSKREEARFRAIESVADMVLSPICCCSVCKCEAHQSLRLALDVTA